jgi:Kef-type K+ transport system membrane component KefB
MEMNLVHRSVGQLILASGAIDDAFGWLMLSVVAAMATHGVRGQDVGAAVASLLGVLAFAVVVGRPLVRAVMRAAHRSPERNTPTSAAVILVLLSAAATHALGLEAVLGAFICGVLLGTARRPDHDPAWAAPLTTAVMAVLAPLFFATAGLRMDLTTLARPGMAVAAVVMVAVAIAGKFLGAFAGSVLSGLNRWEALALGAGMNARGVIEVIIAMVGVRIGLLSVGMFTIIVLVAVVTSLMAPPLLRLAMRRVEQTAEEELRGGAGPSSGRPAGAYELVAQSAADLSPAAHHDGSVDQREAVET